VKRLFGLLALLPALSLAQAEGATVVLQGGTVHPVAGDPIENGRVVFTDGRIVSVGVGAVPAGARVVDLPEGAVVTPGLVGLEAALGLVEISLEPSTVDGHPDRGDAVDAIRAAFSAADAYNPMSTLIPVARRHGVTSVVSTPDGGLVSGVSAWFDLFGAAAQPVETATGLHVNLADDGVDAGGGSPASALTRLREAFEDARLYRQRRSDYDRRRLRELSLSRADLERLGQALAGELPVVVRVSRAADIVRVLALGDDLGLDLVLSGAEEAWMVADRIAAAEVPVVLVPLTNLPSTFTRLHSRYDNAAILSRAGVRVAMTTSGAHDLRNLRQEAGNAVAHGMDPAAALRALTAEPARLFGLEDRYGTLEVGKVANLVVWTGDPFEVTSYAAHVFIGGRDVPTRTRQTLLFERYRDLDEVRRGRR
jgi:imidazolonepropionase-like amidohydrolase